MICTLASWVLPRWFRGRLIQCCFEANVDQSQIDPMVSATLLLTKRAVLHSQQPPKQQTPGIFCMSRTQLEWKPNTPNAAQEITADVATISGQHNCLVLSRKVFCHMAMPNLYMLLQVSCSVPKISLCCGFHFGTHFLSCSLTIWRIAML